MILRILLVYLLALSARLLADSPAFLGPAIFAADNGMVFARVSYLYHEDDTGKAEVYGTAFLPKKDGSDEVLWHFSGLSTYHTILVFLGVDMSHMVIVAPRIGGREPKKDDWGIAFYSRGRLLKKYAPSELVVDLDRVMKSTSSYFWLARDDFSKVIRPSAIELGFWPLRSFWLRTVDDVLYEFDSYTGEILRAEPARSAVAASGGGK